MLNYRDIIYNNYFSTQVNKLNIDHATMLKEQSRHNYRELIHLLPPNKDAKIVDMGCGFGTFVKPTMDAGYKNVSGYDISQEQVKVAHQLGIKNVHCMDIDGFFAKGEKVDVLVGLDIIEHFTKDELINFLTNAKQCLNPGENHLTNSKHGCSPHKFVRLWRYQSRDIFKQKLGTSGDEQHWFYCY